MVSCEEEYVLKDQNFRPRLVVHGVFEAGVPWSISLSTTRNILDATSISHHISDASISISNSKGDFLYNLTYKDGAYTNATYYPEHGATYHLEVRHPDYPWVTAQGYCPRLPGISINSSSIQEQDKGAEIYVDADVYGANTNDYLVWEVINRRQDNSSILGHDINTLSDIALNLAHVFTDDGFMDVNENGKKNGKLTIQNSFFFQHFDDSLNPSDKLETRESKKNGFDDAISESTDIVDYNGRSRHPDFLLSTYDLKVTTLSGDLIQYYIDANELIQDNSKARKQSLGNVKGGCGIFAGINSKSVSLEDI